MRAGTKLVRSVTTMTATRTSIGTDTFLIVTRMKASAQQQGTEREVSVRSRLFVILTTQIGYLNILAMSLILPVAVNYIGGRMEANILMNQGQQK